MYSVVLLLQVGGRLLSNQSNFHYGFAFSIGDIWSHIPELWCNVRHISQKDWDIASASACSTPSRVQCTLRAKFTHSKASDAKYSSAQSITSTYSIFFPCFWNKELLLRKFELQRSALVIEVLWKRVDNMLKNVTGIGARIACVHQTRWNSISGSAPKWPWSISLGLNGAEEKSHKRRARMPICGLRFQRGLRHISRKLKMREIQKLGAPPYISWYVSPSLTDPLTTFWPCGCRRSSVKNWWLLTVVGWTPNSKLCPTFVQGLSRFCTTAKVHNLSRLWTPKSTLCIVRSAKVQNMSRLSQVHTLNSKIRQSTRSVQT